MAELNNILAANEEYSKGFKYGDLHSPPSRKLAVLACMDARLSIEDLLGLSTGDAHVIRNADGIATDDAIRSLIISHELLGCGMLTFTDEDLRERLKEKYKANANGLNFHSFPNLEQNVRDQ